MNLKKEVIKLEKLADKKEVKKGMGIGTTISNKHACEFNKRFFTENEKVLKEAKEEWDRIRQKRKEKYQNYASRKMSQEISQSDKDEHFRRKNFIKSII